MSKLDRQNSSPLKGVEGFVHVLNGGVFTMSEGEKKKRVNPKKKPGNSLTAAKAIIAMPGGVGTLDELFETLTLMQTGKIRKKVPIILYGKEYWDRVVDFQALVDFGTIEAEDLKLMHRSDSVDDAFEYLTKELTENHLSDPDPYM